MEKSSAHGVSGSEFWRTVPTMLGALLAVLAAVDALLAFQPAILQDMSGSWQNLVAVHPVLAPSAHVLAATLAIASVVIASAILLAFARATPTAAHLSLTSACVAVCMLSVTAIHTPQPLPVPTPVFAALSALLFVGAGPLLRLGSRVGTISGWFLIALPFVLLADSYVRAPTATYSFGRDAGVLSMWLGLSVVGVVLIAYARPRASNTDDVDGLEGVDVVEALFEQVERAERSEARVAELERQLNNAYARRRAS
jgi:hypothetical protein